MHSLFFWVQNQTRNRASCYGEKRSREYFTRFFIRFFFKKKGKQAEKNNDFCLKVIFPSNLGLSSVARAPKVLPVLSALEKKFLLLFASPSEKNFSNRLDGSSRKIELEFPASSYSIQFLPLCEATTIPSTRDPILILKMLKARSAAKKMKLNRLK